jgi:YggT family protein
VQSKRLSNISRECGVTAGGIAAMVSPYRSSEPYDEEVVARIEQQDVVGPGGQVIRQDVAVAEFVDNVEARQSRALWLENLIYFIFGGIALLIAMRVLLKAIGANPDNGFTNFIYQLSRLFVAPFLTMVNPIELSETAVFEVASVLAIIIYMILAWLLVRLMVLLFNRPATGVSATRAVGRQNHL